MEKNPVYVPLPVNKTPGPGFEPGSKARQAFMIGHYTIRTQSDPASQIRTGDIAVTARSTSAVRDILQPRTLPG